VTTLIPSMAVDVPGLGLEHERALEVLLMQIMQKSSRNALRRRYYDGKNALRDLGIAIPPQLRKVETVVGWPAKGVDVLSRRITFDSFSLAGGDPASLGVDALWDANRLDIEAPQAHTSALIHSAAFLATTTGDVQSGDPAVLITARSAQYATGIWDQRRRGLSSALSIISIDALGRPDYMVMYLPDTAIIMRREGMNWDLRESRHALGHVPVEPLVFRPELDRPFGHSRISRAVMSLTDSAVRTLLRTEVSAEFYSAPQRYALGADENSFIDASGNQIPAWQAIIGRMLAIGRDEDGNVPTVGQFPQQSMAPHIEQMRELASLFAAETDLMPDTMGVIQENPSSAEAIEQRKEELRLTAEACITSFGASWERTMRTGLTMLDSSPAALAEYARLRANFRNPSTPSMASSADATTKLVAAGVLSPTSEVTYDGLNFSERQREILRAEARRARSTTMLASLTAPVPAMVPDGIAI